MAHNRTTFVCLQPAVSQVERGNCTLTMRALDGRPTPGADPVSDYFVVPPDELRSPSAWYGGPSKWFVDFATCEAGLHNVTVMVRSAPDRVYENLTGTVQVVPSVVSNFTLDCAARSGREVEAGSAVACEMVTLDGCGNPSGVQTSFPSEWQTTLLGAAINEEGADSLTPPPVFQVSGTAPYSHLRGGEVPAGALYTATFDTGFFWTPELNYTERGTAGLSVSFGNVNWTEGGSSSVAVRAAPLSALSTRASCEPATGLLQWHTATCYLSTYDVFGNPQLGADPSHFVATYLANPGPLGESAGALELTEREDVFAVSFQSFEPGDTAGLSVAVSFHEGEETYFASATIQVDSTAHTLCTHCTHTAPYCACTAHALHAHALPHTEHALHTHALHCISISILHLHCQVKSTELVLLPATAVVAVPLSFTVSLDAQGGVYENAVLAFIPGGAAVSGQEGGCLEAPTAPLRAVVDTYTGVVQLDGMVFDEATDYGVCFLVNASSAFPVEQGQPTHGSLPEHYLAWRGRVRALHPVQSLLDGSAGQAGLAEAVAKVGEPVHLAPDSPVVEGQAALPLRFKESRDDERYMLAGDLLRLLPVADGEVPDGNCTGAADNTTAGGLVAEVPPAISGGSPFSLTVTVRRAIRHKVCHAFAHKFLVEVCNVAPSQPPPAPPPSLPPAPPRPPLPPQPPSLPPLPPMVPPPVLPPSIPPALPPAWPMPSFPPVGPVTFAPSPPEPSAPPPPPLAPPPSLPPPCSPPLSPPSTPPPPHLPPNAPTSPPLAPSAPPLRICTMVPMPWRLTDEDFTRQEGMVLTGSWPITDIYPAYAVVGEEGWLVKASGLEYTCMHAGILAHRYTGAQAHRRTGTQAHWQHRHTGTRHGHSS